MRYSPFIVAEQLEHHLGDPRHPDTALGYAKCAALRAYDPVPAEIRQQLQDFLLPAFYVPVEAGGRLLDFDIPVQLLRTLARRDLAATIGHIKSFAGIIPIWVAGDERQTARLAQKVLTGAPVSWGLTTGGHAGDPLAASLRLTGERQGLRASGEQWLIRSPGHAVLVCALGHRQPAAGGSDNLTLVLVDQDQLPQGSVHYQYGGPRGTGEPAGAVRIRLRDAELPPDAVVGTESDGVALSLKSLQLAQVLGAALTLGAQDHALALGTAALGGRAAAGREPHRLRQLLPDVFADHLLIEALTVFAARSVHSLPSELSVTASALRAVVGTVTPTLLYALGEVIGPRNVPPGFGGDTGLWKIARDHDIWIAYSCAHPLHLHTLLNHAVAEPPGTAPRGDRAALLATGRLAGPLPDFDATGLTLMAAYGSSLRHLLPEAALEIAALARRGEVLPVAADAVARFERASAAVELRLDQVTSANAEFDPVALANAEDFALCLAGAAAVQLWLGNHEEASAGDRAELWEGGRWLSAVLERVLQRLGDPVAQVPEAVRTALLDCLVQGARSRRLPSLFSCALG